MTAKTEKATFAAGCFWKPQALFDQVEGVTASRVGYIGGQTQNPTYKDVCYTSTGHAEAVELEYDPETVSYDELLELFFRIHDASQVNRQGPDVGDQYRSEVFTHSEEQAAAAQTKITELSAQMNVATKVTDAPLFWPAEDYHQKYIARRR